MSQRRRQRYTVMLEGETEPRVCLVYDARGAVDFYNRRGQKIIDIHKGDFRRIAKAASAKREGGFRFNQQAIAKAKRDLGLKFPVSVKTHSRYGSTAGNHRFNGINHLIMIKSYLSAEDASRALWHELEHARQAEDPTKGNGDRATWIAYVKRQKRYSYRIRPIEIEARRAEEKAKDRPLCR